MTDPSPFNSWHTSFIFISLALIFLILSAMFLSYFEIIYSILVKTVYLFSNAVKYIFTLLSQNQNFLCLQVFFFFIHTCSAQDSPRVFCSGIIPDCALRTVWITGDRIHTGYLQGKHYIHCAISLAYIISCCLKTNHKTTE